MGNGGWHGTQEEWRRIEAPLEMLDASLEQFSALHGLPITRNQRDWPDRSMVWDAGARCLIQIYLANAETLGINLWICASQDREDGRYWRQEFLCKDTLATDMLPRMPDLLSIAKATLNDWSVHPERLEFATTIAES